MMNRLRLEAAARQAVEPVATDDRCPKCGYLTCHTEHIGCLREAVSAINTFERRNFAIVDVDTHPARTQQAAEPVTDEENEQFSEDVSNYPGSDPEATLFALGEFLKRRGMHPAPTQQPLTEWEPIETAPQDGTEILGYRDGKIAVAYRVPRDDCEMWAFGGTSAAIDIAPYLKPTHWMRIPAPPVEAAHGITSKEGGAA